MTGGVLGTHPVAISQCNQHRRKHAKTAVPSGQGDKGDRRR